MTRRGVIVAACAMAAQQAASASFVIDDRSFFDGRNHTFLDFETRGDGTPLSLGFLGVLPMPSDEYVAQGFRVNGPTAWLDMGPLPGTGASASDAIDAVGSWPTTFAQTQTHVAFEIEFLAPVRSFGIGVAQQAFVHFGEPSEEFTTTITAFNADGEVLGVSTLWGDTIDGGFGNTYANGAYGDQWKIWTYGFLGLATDEPIARLRFDNAWQSNFDDVHFSAVPAPGAGVAFGLLGLGALARRRR